VRGNDVASLGGVVDELRDAAFELDALVARSGLSGKFTSAYRTHAEQERLYRAFISGRARFPVAPPGSSAHEYGEAFDYLVTPLEYQADVGAVWQSWGGVWAGSKDYVHFELPGASERAAERGKNFVAELAQKYNDLPWWATLALPLSLVTTERTPEEQERLAHPGAYLCRRYGLFC